MRTKKNWIKLVTRGRNRAADGWGTTQSCSLWQWFVGFEKGTFGSRGEPVMKFQIPSLSCVEFHRDLRRPSDCTKFRIALLMLLTSNYPFSTYKRERTISSSRFFLMFVAAFWSRRTPNENHAKKREQGSKSNDWSLWLAFNCLEIEFIV